MPIIDVSLLRGRSDAQLRQLIQALHDAVVDTLAVPPESVRILVREVDPRMWGSGGTTIAERRANPGQ
ncbi:4-oxalocrotonate tautomerase family protein [Dactylosporangium sp. NPDC000244]|uniref:tautomerase family protein n=1 Tax=Dactylosporangium sp. NPDC000244 TaxID=3154365 RepID=UPI00331E5375|nr:hypothetical protein GCM10020063_041110 [Dactylosporangium thailandense]